MKPIVRGCKCSKCGKWHDIIYKVHGKSVCCNCYYRGMFMTKRDFKEVEDK